MSDTFNAVNNRTGKVIGWIDLILVSCTRMTLDLASHQDRISQSGIVCLHVKLCTNSTSTSIVSTILHLLPHLQVLFNRVVSVLGLNLVSLLLSEEFLLSVIDIGSSLSQHLLTEL
ncbi:hypothetical protein D3C80_1825000 [compost metagenome]